MPDSSPNPTPQPGLLVAPTRTPPTLPIAFVAQQIAKRVQTNAQSLYAQLYSILTADYASVWSPTAQGFAADGKTLVTVTTQQIFDAMKDASGKPAAASIVAGHGMLAPVAEQVRQLYGDPNSTPIPQAVPAATTLTLNPDGSVTVSAAAPAPAPEAAPATAGATA